MLRCIILYLINTIVDFCSVYLITKNIKFKQKVPQLLGYSDMTNFVLSIKLLIGHGPGHILHLFLRPLCEYPLF